MSTLRIRRNRPFLILLALVVASFCSPSLTAQSQTSNELSFQLKVQSNLVIVRVVVRNAKGEPVRGLKREDFKVLDQGKEQSITQFEEHASDEGSDESTSATPRRETASPTTAHRERFIALYFDDLNSSDADLMQARDAADHFFATGLQPNDRVAIFSAEKMLSDFTSDPHQFHAALMQLHASSMGPAREHPCPDLSDYQALEILHTNDPDSEAWRVAWAESKTCPVRSFASSPDPSASHPDSGSMVAIRMLAQKIVDQSQSLSRSSLEQFEQVVKLISKAPGERSVVLVSPGFLSQSEQYALDRIIDQALRAQVVINSLDPKGLSVLMRESDASKNTSILADPRAAQARYHLDASRAFVGADVLAEFAEGTGGTFFHSDNDLKAGFGALVGDPPHYILAFSPRNEKWDGKFHALKVSLATKQKGESVQARRGYFAVENTGTEQAANAKNPSVSPETQPSKRVEASTKGGSTDVAGAGLTDSTPVSPLTAAALASKSTEKPDDGAKLSANAKPVHIRKGMNRVTVDQLEQILTSSHGRSDAELAKQLAEMELIERLDSDRLAHLDLDLPGAQSRQALVAQADSSAFLKPPAAQAPLPPTPTVDEQIQWLKLAANYATKALSKLPNFFAAREVIQFADSPARQEYSVFYPYEPLHVINQSKATVLYREGKQTLDAEEKGGTESPSLGLVTTGEFGPILGTVLADSSRSSLTWSHWESRASGPVAVYRFAVPRDKSHYQVKFCCLAQRAGTGAGLFEQISAYHGEITVDPANGNILRIMLQADLKEAYPMTRADLMVEYGPVEIGGKAYICPLRSVAIAMAYSKSRPKKSEIPDPSFFVSSNDRELPVETMINDIAFDHYHVFRTDSRIIPADDQSPQ
ncbi:VWA domain-containing protein [Telmatobacter sp. DSM 110680]|uniref:VWA domain-containing protein n=1 Tax=Telmatobacter sp. DSM 110680 TaxID=3036704 RepID=A0AAU7DGP3_9BACT